MDKINRPTLNSISALSKLQNNWQQWGIEFQLYLDGDKHNGQNFSWREGIKPALRDELKNLTESHCSFCDGYPFDMSKETSKTPHKKTNLCQLKNYPSLMPCP